MAISSTAAAARDTWIAECAPYDAVSGATKDVRLTTAKTWNTRGGDTPANSIYRPGLRIEGFGSSIVDVEGGQIGGFLDARAGELFVPNTDGALDEWLRYSWMERPVTVWKVAKGAAHSTRAVEYKGYVSGVTVGQKEARIAFESFNAKLARKKVTEQKFWGRARRLHFASTGQHVSLGDVHDYITSFTIEVLFRLDSAGMGTVRYLVNKAGQYFIRVSSADQLVFSANGTGTVFSTTTLVANTWYWASCVYDSTANLKTIYLNAKLDNQNSETTDPTNTANAVILGRDTVIGTQGLQGDLAEVRFWSTVRTALEVSQYMYSFPDKATTGFDGWYRFAEGTGTTLGDETTPAQNGTITSAVWGGTYEGEEDVAGQRKPWGIGIVFHCEPRLIDRQKLIYMVDVRGLENAEPAVYIGASTVTSNGASSDLWNNVPAAGQFKYDETRGLIRLQAEPTVGLRLSMTYTSKEVGAGAYASYRPWTALEAILIESAGFTSSDIDSALLQTTNSTAFDGWLGSFTTCGFWSADGEMSCSEAIALILDSFRARGGFEDDGVFRASTLTRTEIPNSATSALTKDDVRDTVTIATLQPVKEVLVRHSPYWPPYSVSEIATGVAIAVKVDAQRQYRESRSIRVLDRFGRSFDAYKDDARQLVRETVIAIPGAGSSNALAGIFADSFFDAHDTYTPVWETKVLNPARNPKIGEIWTFTHDRLELDAGVECLVVGRSRTIAGSHARLKVQLVDASTLAS
jgi:hypothetical protein